MSNQPKPANVFEAMTQEEMLLEVKRLTEENAKLKASPRGPGIHVKIGEKGNLVISGIGRFPISLYVSQFDALDAAWDMIREFVKANRDKLSVKTKATA